MAFFLKESSFLTFHGKKYDPTFDWHDEDGLLQDPRTHAPYCHVDTKSLPRDIINYLLRDGFTKDYTKASILTVKLQVVDRLWPVKLYVYKRSVGSSCVVSIGWSAFARENSLRVGDVCVFELIMRDGVVLNVHIFRCLD
ncbi:hypothetical protein RGQ29_031179 [Quercus rubra]|uniref:TF-B3 domain-containing protein n=1 Tax=Quercus rubra TaxID=3512 RepID=A0AAN7ELD8_QUERU|nr:hypothetical protein RGQ29_031179 [Quercus rubra]